MKSNIRDQDLQDDKIAAIGIGAMIVFIALILVAAVAAAVIIQTAEQLQQNAQKTGDDTADNMAGKVMINAIYVDPASQDNYKLFVRLAPGSEPTPTTSISYQLFCDVIVSGALTNGNVQLMSTGTGNTATMAPSTGYVMTIQGNVGGNNCGVSSGTIGIGDSVTLYLHVGSGGSTLETLTIQDETAGAKVV
jgi:archaellum component FlaG (FlaF/FlaG flagellin family)